MGTFHQLWMILGLIVVYTPMATWTFGVSFPQTGDLYVALDKKLVLNAKFELQPGEKIRLVLWDRLSNKQEIRLATNSKTTDKRISVDENRARLSVSNLTHSDYGTYTVTVTDENGYQKSASRKVMLISTPPAVSLSLQCIMKNEGAMWDLPTFSWEVDGKMLTNDTGNLLEDGRSLQLLGDLHHNYTCTVDSSQGSNTVSVTVQEPDQNQGHESSWTVCIVFVVIEAVVIVALAVWICMLRNPIKRRNRG